MINDKQDIHGYIANIPPQSNIFYFNKIDKSYTLGIINNLQVVALIIFLINQLR